VNVLTRARVILLAAVAISGCSEQPYRLGVWAGPTGANVAKLVEQDINYNGGVGDRRMHIRVVSQAMVSFNELTAEALKLSLDSMVADTTLRAVVTRMTDTVTEAAARRFESAGIPYLITNPVSNAFLQSHPHAFLLVPTVEDQAEFLVEQVAAEPAPRRVALFSLREPHADSLATAIRRALQARGMSPVVSMTFPQTADSYTMQAKAAETGTYRPNIVLFIGRTPSLYEVYGTFLNQLPNVRVICSDLVETFHLYGNPGQRYTGVRFVRFFDPLAPDSMTISLRDRLWAWIGRDELNSEAAVTYEGLRGLAELMKQGALSREALTQALRGGKPMAGVLGPWQFDADRKAKRPMQLAEVRSDTVVVVPASPRAALARQ
jgi:ABC-type branched-subunit amino acid transport system substrate-binding protein